MKRFLGFLALVLLCLPTGATAQEAQYTLDIGTIAPEGTPWAEQLRDIETRFEEGRTESLVRERLGPCTSVAFQPLPLRQILRAHAQALRLGRGITS